MSIGRSPSDFINASKTKYALAQARLRRGEVELALLSLRGSLEDALRAHLLLYGHAAADAEWATLIEMLSVEEGAAAGGDTTLTPDERERLRRMHHLHLRIAAGDAVTLPSERLAAYHRFSAQILQRFGVLVVAPESGLPIPTRRMLEEEPVERPWSAFWRKGRFPLIPVLVILFIFLVGAGTAIVIQQVSFYPVEPRLEAAAPTVVPPPTTPDVPRAAAFFTSVALPPNGLIVGRTAYVRTETGEGLALRARPGTAPDIPVQLYLSPDTAVQVIGGPIEADGYTWWQVRAVNMEGWCAGSFLEVR